jgi:hypothetical protein
MGQVGTEVVPEHRRDSALDVLLWEHVAEPVEMRVELSDRSFMGFSFLRDPPPLR